MSSERNPKTTPSTAERVGCSGFFTCLVMAVALSLPMGLALLLDNVERLGGTQRHLARLPVAQPGQALCHEPPSRSTLSGSSARPIGRLNATDRKSVV